MKPIKIFVLILFVGSASLNLFAQSQEEYMAEMDEKIGEWMLDKESMTMDPPSDQAVPDLKMTFTKEGDSYERTVFYKSEEGKWMVSAKELYTYDAKNKWLAYTGEDSRGEHFRGQMILMENGQMHGVNFNSNNQKTSETVVDKVSPDKMKASIKSFVYPKNADEDMRVVNVETTWLRQ